MAKPAEATSPFVVARLLPPASGGSAKLIPTVVGKTIKPAVGRIDTDPSKILESFAVDALLTPEDASGSDVKTECVQPLVAQLLEGIDGGFIVLGCSASDQRDAIIGSGFLTELAAALFEALHDEPPHGMKRTHEVRVGCALLQHEEALDLLAAPPSTSSGATAAAAAAAPPGSPGSPPRLRLKRSGGRRGLHISGQRTPVASSIAEVSEAFAIADVGRRALAVPGSCLVFEFQLTQRLIATPIDPLAAFTTEVTAAQRLQPSASPLACRY